ncbi:uncharacterized protein J3D65DRAFT_201940 [Phyllosticta citribraziliensis]|uniref:Uncharacterized protein n=1 Tax=Phyllosticta citribraziliensis TaxID=989973 RepID=A0ABR1M3G6_9PEZI
MASPTPQRAGTLGKKDRTKDRRFDRSQTRTQHYPQRTTLRRQTDRPTTSFPLLSPPFSLSEGPPPQRARLVLSCPVTIETTTKRILPSPRSPPSKHACLRRLLCFFFLSGLVCVGIGIGIAAAQHIGIIHTCAVFFFCFPFLRGFVLAWFELARLVQMDGYDAPGRVVAQWARQWAGIDMRMQMERVGKRGSA